MPGRLRNEKLPQFLHKDTRLFLKTLVKNNILTNSARSSESSLVVLAELEGAKGHHKKAKKYYDEFIANNKKATFTKPGHFYLFMKTLSALKDWSVMDAYHRAYAPTAPWYKEIKAQIKSLILAKNDSPDDGPSKEMSQKNFARNT